MSPRRYRPPALYMKAPFLKNLLNGMMDAVKVIDPQFRVVYANETSLKKIGVDLNELRGRVCHQAFYGFKHNCFFCSMKKVFDVGLPQVGYVTLPVKGVNRNFEITDFPIPLPGPGRKVEYAVEIVRDVTPLSRGGALPQNLGKIISRDKNFLLALDRMAQWAGDFAPVLLQGEEGTGKKSFAQAMHQRGPRAAGPFQIFHSVVRTSVDYWDGLFGEGGAWEKANDGTLYLDEISRLGEESQQKLALKLSTPDGPDDPRVVASTSEDIHSLVYRKVIRLDLYNHFVSRVLILPPLRDRKQDLPYLADYFIETYKVLNGSKAESLGPVAMTQLMAYSWPGNIRELETQIQRACLLAKGPQIEKLDVSIEVPPKMDRLDDCLDLAEKTYLTGALAKTRGRLAEIAKLASLNLKTLQRRMKKYGLKAAYFRNLPD